MKKAIVTVQFVYEGKTFESENEQGLLLGDKVLVVASEGGADFGLYKVQQSADPGGVVIVDLDANSTNFLEENPTLLLELLVA